MLPLPAGGLLHLLLLAAIAALVSGLAAVERKAAFQLMLSRPLALATLLGWALGDARGGLRLGIPLELLFLGGVNLGGSLPDNETLLASCLAAAVVPAGLIAGTGVDPALAALGFGFLFPLALFGRRLDHGAEQRNVALLDEALARARSGDPSAVRLNLRGMLLPFGATALLAGACALLSPLLASARLSAGHRLVWGLGGAWQGIWVLAAGCAIRAIRDRRAPWIAAAAGTAAALVTWFARSLP